MKRIKRKSRIPNNIHGFKIGNNLSIKETTEEHNRNYSQSNSTKNNELNKNNK